jgi:hypothetical protein
MAVVDARDSRGAAHESIQTAGLTQFPIPGFCGTVALNAIQNAPHWLHAFLA